MGTLSLGPSHVLSEGLALWNAFLTLRTIPLLLPYKVGSQATDQ